jgi:hypothetical protein
MNILSNINNDNNNINKNINNFLKTKLVSIFGSLKSVYLLNDQFDLNKFKLSVEKTSQFLDIPIYIVDNESNIFLKNYEIYFIIRNNKLILYTSHKFYDAVSQYLFIHKIHNYYNNLDDPFPIDSSIIKNLKDNNSLLNNVTLFSNHFNSNDEVPEDLILLKVIKGGKTRDILEEYQSLLLDFMVVIDSRSIHNVKMNSLGNYFDMYYLTNQDIPNFTDNLKKLKSVSDIPSINFFEPKEYIFFNSLLKFSHASFLGDILPITQYSFNGITYHKYYMTIGVPNSEGFSSIYVNKNLYDLIQKN